MASIIQTVLNIHSHSLLFCVMSYNRKAAALCCPLLLISKRIPTVSRKQTSVSISTDTIEQPGRIALKTVRKSRLPNQRWTYGMMTTSSGTEVTHLWMVAESPITVIHIEPDNKSAYSLYPYQLISVNCDCPWTERSKIRSLLSSIIHFCKNNFSGFVSVRMYIYACPSVHLAPPTWKPLWLEIERSVDIKGTSEWPSIVFSYWRINYKRSQKY